MENLIRKRVNNMDGIKRLADMLEGQKDKYLIIIVNHLMLQTEMNEAFLNEEKNLKDMAFYIKDMARKQVTNNVAVIEDEVVFQWAKDYFNKSNEELGIKKKEDKTPKVNSKGNTKKEDEFGSIFGTIETAKVEDKKDNIEQISLFGV
jgi:hypothetical protein